MIAITLFQFLLTLRVTISQLSDRTQIHVHLNPETLKDTVNFVAVFLLTTLEGSAEFGQGPKGDFFQRVRASRYHQICTHAIPSASFECTIFAWSFSIFHSSLHIINFRSTWAYPIRHYYAVVGNNDNNLKILQNSKYCHSLTQHYRDSTKLFTSDNKEEIYKCNGIKVLYLPYCDSSSWGPMVSMLICV